jgi:hypothetical protein
MNSSSFRRSPTRLNDRHQVLSTGSSFFAPPYANQISITEENVDADLDKFQLKMAKLFNKQSSTLDLSFSSIDKRSLGK